MAAVAIEQSRTRESVRRDRRDGARLSAGDLPDERPASGHAVSPGDIARDERYQKALGLVRLVEEISRAGDHELTPARPSCAPLTNTCGCGRSPLRVRWS
jgi:hypothetical protein